MPKINKPNLSKPTPFGDIDTWGFILNENIDKTSVFLDEVIRDLEDKDQEIARLERTKVEKTEIEGIVQTVTDKYLETNIKPEIDNYFNTTTKPAIDEYVTQKQSDLNTHTDNKKKELDTYEKTKETELNRYAESERTSITNHTTSKITEVTEHTDSEKLRITTHTDDEIIRIQSAGESQITAVGKEGTKQIDLVTAEGEKQVQAVIQAGGELNNKVSELEKNKLSQTDTDKLYLKKNGGDTFTGILKVNNTSNTNIQIAKNNTIKGELNVLDNGITLVNNTSKHSLVMLDSGNTTLQANNLFTVSKEVVSAINEMYDILIRKYPTNPKFKSIGISRDENNSSPELQYEEQLSNK